MRSAILALAAALFVASPALAERGTLQPAELDHDAYGETWTFIADLDGGAYAQVQFSVTNLGPGSGHGICRALIVEPGGEPWTSGERVTRSKWKHAKTGDAEMLQVGPCRVRKDGGDYTINARLEDRNIQLRYLKAKAAETPASNELQVGGGRHVTKILMPSAEVQLRVQAKGAKPLSVKGAGYADQSRSTVEPKELARRWVRFRSLRGETKSLLLGREAIAGGFEPVWLRGANGSYEKLASFAMERGGAGKAPSYVVTVAGAGDRRLVLRSGGLLYRYAPVEELGVLSSVVKPFAGSPVTYTYRATLEGAGGKAVPGILEISVSEE